VPPGHPDAPGYRGPAGDAPFDGGYAKVIRASDHPVRPAGRARPPGFGRPAEPTPPAAAAAGVYVYRDTGDEPGGPAATGQGPGGNDAAYWYDLPGSAAGPGAPPQPGEEARGPFEPLVSSSDPPGAARRSSTGPDAAESAVPDAAHADQAPADSAAGDAPAESAYDRARKLEQIKDLYLTAEAIGEANVDKHFDQLLAQQRELISDYFRQPGPAGSAGGAQPVGQAGSADQPETGLGARRDPGPPSAGPRRVLPGTPLPGTPLPDGTLPDGPFPGGPTTPPEGVGVAADHPRAW
jgi:hypothetical protein